MRPLALGSRPLLVDIHAAERFLRIDPLLEGIAGRRLEYGGQLVARAPAPGDDPSTQPIVDILLPAQIVSAAAYRLDPIGQQLALDGLPEGMIVTGTIHSHHALGAFESGTDARNNAGFATTVLPTTTVVPHRLPLAVSRHGQRVHVTLGDNVVIDLPGDEPIAVERLLAGARAVRLERREVARVVSLIVADGDLHASVTEIPLDGSGGALSTPIDVHLADLGGPRSLPGDDAGLARLVLERVQLEQPVTEVTS